MRGVAIVLVVIHHTAIRIPLAGTALAAVLPLPLLSGLSWDGYEAVFVFFVVSGFLITRNAVARWGRLRELNVGAFYARRGARILPCLLVLVAVLALLDLLRVPDYAIARADQSLPRAALAALTFHLNWYEGRTGYLPGGWDVLWSLSIEEVFYIGFPVVCLVVGRRHAVAGVLFGVAALSLPLSLDALAGASEIWREKAYLPGMAAIAMGCCAAVVAASVPRPRHAAVPSALGWACVGTLGCLFWWEPAFIAVLGNGAMLVLTGATGLLMVAFAWGWGRVRAGRGTAWLRSFGLMSYEIYLTHMFVVFPVVGLFRWSGGDLRTGWVWFVPVLGFAWVLGWLVDRLLSRPAGRWLRGRSGLAGSALVAARAGRMG